MDTMSLQVVCEGNGFVQSLGGPFVFNDLSEAGILPGWTCNITGCFAENDGEELFFRTELASCTLPLTGELHQKIAVQHVG